MSYHDVLPDDMDPPDPASFTPPAVDFATIDRLLAGRLEEADTPPGYATMATLVAAATPPVDQHELAGEQVAIAEFVATARARPAGPTPRRRRAPGRLVRVKAAAAVVAAVLSIGGVAAAATGRLHRPAPSAADRASSTSRDDAAARPPAGSSPTAAASATPSRTTQPPARPSLAAALANLTRVITTTQRQGTADPAAADLLPQARDVVHAALEGNAEDTANKLADLQRKTDELIRQGKIRPAAAGPIRQAVAQFSAAVQRWQPSAQPPGPQGPGRQDATAEQPGGPPAPGRGDHADEQVAAKDR